MDDHRRAEPAAGPLGAVAEAEARRRRELRRMKVLAAALLVIAALIYALTLHRDGGLGFVNAGSEAAMVGALADWFAVTALFRRPLGLPIPHTALIPTRKDALGRSLQEFVATNFLAEPVIRERVAAIQVARRAGEWLAQEPSAERVAAELSSVAQGALRVLRDDEVTGLLDEVVLRPMLKQSWGPPAGQLLGRVVAEGAHHKLIDLAVNELHVWLMEHEQTVERLVIDRAPSWTPAWLDERLARRIYVETLRWAEDVRADPRHRVRIALDDLLTGLATDLQSDPGTMRHADELRDRVLNHPGLRDALGSVWISLRRVLHEATADPDSRLRHRTVAGLRAFGHRLSLDAGLQASLDGYLEDAIAHLVTTYRDEAATVISETVQRWDGAEASRRIELHVGRDLQFIRINGTVVGALAGLAIHAVTVLAG